MNFVVTPDTKVAPTSEPVQKPEAKMPIDVSLIMVVARATVRDRAETRLIPDPGAALTALILTFETTVAERVPVAETPTATLLIVVSGVENVRPCALLSMMP